MHFDFDDFFGGVGGGSRYRYFKWRWRPAVAGRGGGAFSFLCFFVCWLWNPGMRINYSKIAKRRLKSTKITILFLRIDKKKTKTNSREKCPCLEFLPPRPGRTEGRGQQGNARPWVRRGPASQAQAPPASAN